MSGKNDASISALLGGLITVLTTETVRYVVKKLNDSSRKEESMIMKFAEEQRIFRKEQQEENEKLEIRNERLIELIEKLRDENNKLRTENAKLRFENRSMKGFE